MSKLDENLIKYYSKRAGEYEEIYHRSDPKRQKELTFIGEYIKKTFKNRYVLELACGTGYWTKYLLKSANKIVAIDASYEMLKITSKRYASHSAINFILADAYDPPVAFPPFTGAMANFWFSHIPKKRISAFLSTLHSRLAKRAFVLFVDDIYHEGIGGELVTEKGSPNIWKRRELMSGEKYEIIKNYYSKDQLLTLFSSYSQKAQVHFLTYYWLVGYFYNTTQILSAPKMV